MGRVSHNEMGSETDAKARCLNGNSLSCFFTGETLTRENETEGGRQMG